jgi:hypothetical protein
VILAGVKGRGTNFPDALSKAQVAALLSHYAKSHHFRHSPNSDSDEAYQYWLQLADFYTWPHVTIFNSFDELFRKLKLLDLNVISEKMSKFNKIKEANMLANWCQILKKQDTNQAKIPNSYKGALKYFDIDRIHINLTEIMENKRLKKNFRLVLEVYFKNFI